MYTLLKVIDTYTFNLWLLIHSVEFLSYEHYLRANNT